MRGWLWILAGLIGMSLPNAWAAQRVAVFDFDDRLAASPTTAKYIQARLEERLPGIRVDQYTGNKDVARSIEVLRALDWEHYDLIVTITSDALLIANHVLRRTPVLFTNATNPLHLGFETLGPPGGNISGASYYIAVEKQLAFYRRLMPDLARLGFIFDMNNKSRKIELPEARKACRNIGLSCRMEVVSSEAELEEAAARLIGSGAQAVAIGSSDLLYNHISRILPQCTDALVPIFSFNRKGVVQGAVAALSSDYNLMVDQLLVPMALAVLLEGQSPGEMPIAFLKENRIFINPSQAEKLKLSVPKSVRAQAGLIR